MIKVYIGGSFSARHRIRAEAEKLEGYGYRVLSHWFKDEHFIEKAWDNNFGGDVAELMAMGDLYQLLEAQLVIIDTIDKSSTGGSDSEIGAAIAKAILTGTPNVVHIGPYRNIFQNLAREHYDSWEEFFEKLELGLYGGK